MMSSTSTSRAKSTKEKIAKTQSAHTMKADGLSKVQPTAEQIRIAQIGADKGDEAAIKDKINQVMSITGRTEDEVTIAMHDCDMDASRAIELLLEEGNNQGEWQESTKKKKNKANVKAAGDAASNHKTDSQDRNGDKDCEILYEEDNYTRRNVGPRMSRGRAPPRLSRGRSDNTWKGRESEENEKNKSESRSRDRGRGRGNRGGGAGRGRGRTGRGGGGFRGNKGDMGSTGGSGDVFDCSGPQIDTWTNETAVNAEKNTFSSPVEDWGAEDWTGTLEESKVFTPSVTAVHSEPTKDVFSGLSDNDSKMFSAPPMSVETPIFPTDSPLNTLTDSSNNVLAESLSSSLGGTSNLGPRLDLDMILPKVSSSSNRTTVYNSQSSQFESQYSATQQSQFITDYNKQATESIKNAVGIGCGSSGLMDEASVNSPASQTAVSQDVPQLQSRPKTTQRSKLPPPSKIPASAVEMPGNINYSVDVQFGTWDYGQADSNSFSFGAPPNNTSTVSNSYINTASSISQAGSQPPSRTNVFQQDGGTPPKDYSQSGMSQSAKIASPPDPIPFPDTDRKPSPQFSNQRSAQATGNMGNSKSGSPPQMPVYSQQSYSAGYASSGYQSQKPTGGYSNASTAGGYTRPTNSSLASGGGQYGNHQNSYSSFQNEGTGSFQATQNSLYPSSSQSTNSFQSAGNSQQNPNGGSSYQTNSYQNSSSNYGNQGGAYQAQGQAGNSSYQSYRGDASSNSSYQSSTGAPPVAGGSANSFQAPSGQSGSPATYQDSASAYSVSQSGSNTGFGHQNAYGNNLQNSANKLSDNLKQMSVKDSSLDSVSQHSYDLSSSSSSSTTSLTNTTASSSASLTAASVSLNMSTSSVSTLSSSVTSSAVKSSVTSKAPPNLPLGVPPIVGAHAYMPNIGGVHNFPFAANFPGLPNQPQVYGAGYEELQMLARLPMHGYYDNNTMPFQQQQTPSTMSAGRDQTTLPNAAYTGADGKLNRVEAQSPTVQPQTSQPQSHTAAAAQQQQQPYISPAALPPGYNSYTPYHSGVLPNFYYAPNPLFQVGNIVPNVTNATPHGSTTANSQFQKPGAYGSHAYGTGGQSQDYSKNYGGASQATAKASAGSVAVTSSSTDLSGAGYGKAHTQSFDKSGFHAGTPPPFGLANLPTGNQAGPMGAPTAAYGGAAAYVPVMAHQPHSQILHHPMQQDSTGGSSRSSQQSTNQVKTGTAKTYQTPYWSN